MNRILAFLGTSVRNSKVDILNNWRLTSTLGDTKGEVIYNGEVVPFKIITKVYQLEGLLLIGYEVLEHAQMNIDFELIEVAIARMR